MRLYRETSDYSMRIDESGEHVFLHLDVRNWNKSVLKDVRLLVELVREEYKSKGYVAVFATADNDKTVKFWNKIRPCDHIRAFGPDNRFTLGAWETE